jgi:hypothetical protein
MAPAGTSLIGDFTARSDEGTFTFASVDIYSSTTRIPYEIIGTLRGAEVFSMRAEQGNTFGRFASITNGMPGAAVDTLRIRLTNPAAPCCANPVGLDTLRVVR